MAKSLSGEVKVRVQANLQNTLDLVVASDPLNIVRRMLFTNGTGDDQFDMSFHDIRTLTTGQSLEIDVKGVLDDAFGDEQNFVEIGFIFIRNLSAVDVLLVGGAAEADALLLFNNFSDIVPIREEGFFLWAAPNDGKCIVVGTHDKLKVEHGGVTTNDLQYEIVLLGRSA